MARKTPKPPDRGVVRHVALLRGINVGGKNMLPMAALTKLFVDAGCVEVSTYIQSGNVVFGATPAVAKRLSVELPKLVHKKYGFEPRLMVRSADEFREAAAGNPFMKSGVDTKSLFVGFLDTVPPARLVAALDPDRSPGDKFAVRGREIYLFLTNGPIKTRLTGPYVEATLKVSSTVRNWNTVMKLASMVGEVSEP